MNVWPAIVTVALRGSVALFTATFNFTVPFPEPLAPLLTTTHGVLVTAVHAHPLAAVTPTWTIPPEAGTLADDEEIDGAQTADAA